MSDECTCEDCYEWIIEGVETPDPNGPSEWPFCSNCDLPISLEDIEAEYEVEYYGDEPESPDYGGDE
jgi:hypothetical protein